MKAVPLLAEALNINPSGLRTCVALRIESPDEPDYDEGEEDPMLFAAKCRALEVVLNNLAEHAQLREFRWMWEKGWSICGNGRIPPEVWAALARNGKTLQVMNVEHTSEDGSRPYEDSWVCNHRGRDPLRRYVTDISTMSRLLSRPVTTPAYAT